MALTIIIVIIISGFRLVSFYMRLKFSLKNLTHVHIEEAEHTEWEWEGEIIKIQNRGERGVKLSNRTKAGREHEKSARNRKTVQKWERP